MSERRVLFTTCNFDSMCAAHQNFARQRVARTFEWFAMSLRGLCQTRCAPVDCHGDWNMIQHARITLATHAHSESLGYTSKNVHTWNGEHQSEMRVQE